MCRISSSLPAKQPYSFYNQDCKDCTPVNKPPPRPWDPTKPGQPTQIARVTPIDAPTMALNKSWQAALACGQSGLALAVLRSYQHPVADADVERLQRAVGRPARPAIRRRSFSPTPPWKATSRATRSQRVVKLHRVPQERRRDDRQVLRLHVHAVDGEIGGQSGGGAQAVMANSPQSSCPPSAYLMSPRPYPGRGALFHG